jgi:hypothetical protein
MARPVELHSGSTSKRINNCRDASVAITFVDRRCAIGVDDRPQPPARVVRVLGGTADLICDGNQSAGAVVRVLHATPKLVLNARKPPDAVVVESLDRRARRLGEPPAGVVGQSRNPAFGGADLDGAAKLIAFDSPGRSFVERQ